MAKMTPEARMTVLNDKIDAAISEAISHANEHNLDFSIYPAYGMGGTYSGEDGEWYPSSESC